MRRLPEHGQVRTRWLSLDWGESIKDLGRRVYVDIGDQDHTNPRWRLQLRVVTTPRGWMPPHDTRIEVSVGRNRGVRLDLLLAGPRYREGGR